MTNLELQEELKKYPDDGVVDVWTSYRFRNDMSGFFIGVFALVSDDKVIYSIEERL